MAVVFARSHPIFTRPATYYAPAGAGFDAWRFTIDFKVLSGDELKALNERYEKGELSNAGLLDEVVKGWHGLKDAEAQEVPYSIAERKATEAEYPGFEQSMAIAFFDAVAINQRTAAVLAEEAAKNSEAQSSTTTG